MTIDHPAHSRTDSASDDRIDPGRRRFLSGLSLLLGSALGLGSRTSTAYDWDEPPPLTGRQDS